LGQAQKCGRVKPIVISIVVVCFFFIKIVIIGLKPLSDPVETNNLIGHSQFLRIFLLKIFNLWQC